MTLSPKQVTGAGALVAIGLAAAFFARDAAAAPLIAGIAFLGAVAIFYAGSGAVAAVSLEGLLEAARRAASGDKLTVPATATGDTLRLYEALTGLADGRRKDRDELSSARSQLSENEAMIQESAHRLESNVQTQLSAAEETARLITDLTGAVHEIATHLEALTHSAEESSSSILQMTATNDEVAENVGELAGSVRETVSSIEEMAYSIKEVARNVDALSLTAEETSSSMNQMDVSIDQVQSNANETARLSEEVALDAEKGAEAILKTIGEIYRIKESSQEAVSVISSLGSRIEAIGQIVNVIDDVAEQTNLLALNAAIIAAQAGEQGSRSWPTRSRTSRSGPARAPGRSRTSSRRCSPRARTPSRPSSAGRSTSTEASRCRTRPSAP
jgi:methyl-accepting chemotaxis protein